MEQKKERKESEFIMKLLNKWVLVDIEANTWREVSRAEEDFEWTLFKQILQRDIVHVGDDE